MEQAKPPGSPSKKTDGDPRLPIYQRLRDEFARLIATQAWRPGQAIPAELTLAAKHDVAPGTVRRAIEALVGEGLLVRRQGKGTFVRRADFTTSLFRFFRFHGAGGERRVPESRILRIEHRPAPAEVAKKLQLAQGVGAIQLSRLRLFDGTPFLFEEIWLPDDAFSPLLELAPDEFGDLLYPLYERLCGKVVASATESLAAEAAQARYARPLRLAPGTPVIVIERLALGYDFVPLEWRRSRGPAERFRYQVEIR
jgi:GntR family transcriptional regulator